MNKVLFLPSDYQAPKSSGYYMKFQDGENKFRILSKPIIGWEDWMDKKPVRFRFDNKPAKSFDPKKPIKHFWAMIVWNYHSEEIQILQITQASIRKHIEALSVDEDWGAPFFYDLKIIKSGEGIDTEYSLNPLPHKVLPAHIKDLFNERKCNLDALFDNGDPFSKENDAFTTGIFSPEDSVTTLPNISLEQAYDLESILDDCDPNYKKWFFDYMKNQYKTENITDLPAHLFPKMKTAASKNLEAHYAKQRADSSPDFLQGLAQ